MKSTHAQLIYCASVIIWILLIPTLGCTQDLDSSFWAHHSYHQPDSLLLKDSFWFPPHSGFEEDIYTQRTETSKWAGLGARFYGNFGMWHSALITLRGDHIFLFEAGFEVGNNLTVGRWSKVADSIIVLQWDDTLSLHLCRDTTFAASYFQRKRRKNNYPWPLKIENWRFIMRNDQLVPVTCVDLRSENRGSM